MPFPLSIASAAVSPLLLLLAQAPSPAGAFFAGFYDAPACGAGAAQAPLQPLWSIQGPSGLCLRVPNEPNRTYMTYCDAGSSGGTFVGCSDAACVDCPSVARFTGDQCLPLGAPYGGELLPSLQLSCAEGAHAAPLVPTPGSDSAVITYFASGDCSMPEGYRTEYRVASSACNVMQGNAVTPGLVVECSAATPGSGVYRLCSTADCTACDAISTPFTNDQCLPQGAQGGASLSVSIRCALPAPPTPSASGTPSATPTPSSSGAPPLPPAATPTGASPSPAGESPSAAPGTPTPSPLPAGGGGEGSGSSLRGSSGAGSAGANAALAAAVLAAAAALALGGGGALAGAAW